MTMQDQELRELQEERGYGAAGDDVNESSPDQAQQNQDPLSDETQDEFTDELDEAEEDGPGRGAD